MFCGLFGEISRHSGRHTDLSVNGIALDGGHELKDNSTAYNKCQNNHYNARGRCPRSISIFEDLAKRSSIAVLGKMFHAIRNPSLKILPNSHHSTAITKITLRPTMGYVSRQNQL